MELRELARQLDAMTRRRAALSHPGTPPDEAIEALDSSLEELRAAGEELSRLGDQLDQSRLEIEREHARYRELFELAPVGYLVTDAHGAVLEANRAAAELLNIRPRHLLRKPLVYLVAEGDRPAFTSRIRRLARVDLIEPFETRMQPRHRAAVDVELIPSVSRDFDGRPTTIRWALHDLTARLRAERLVRGLNDTLEARVRERTAELEAEFLGRESLLIAAHAGETDLLDLVQGVDAILWRADPATGRYTFVSRRAEELLGHPATRWVDEPDFWAGLIHPEDREWAVKNRARAVDEGRDHEAEYRMIAADGRTVWFRESVRVRRDDEGRPAELRGLMVNISRRKKVERQLYADRRQLSQELDELRFVHDLFARLSPSAEPEAVLEQVLHSVAAVLGAESGGFHVRDPDGSGWRLAASLDLAPEFARRVAIVPEGSPWIGRVMAVDETLAVEDVLALPAHGLHLDAIRSGMFRGVYSLAFPSRAGEPLGCLTVLFAEPYAPGERPARLVAEYARKAAEFVENALLRRRLAEADRRKDEGLATLVHELRSPISAILHASALLGRPDAEGGHDREACEAIDRQARQMARLVEDLMEFSRLRAGKAQLRRGPVDLAAVVARAVAAAIPSAEAKGLTLALDPTDSVAWIDGDEGRLEQVVANLLTNAARFTDPGGSIRVGVEAGPAAATLRVRDTGIGIAPEVRPRLFSLFSQERHGRGGLGIGLALVKGLVELHGGTVEVASAGRGRGSEFVVRLPAGPPGPPPPPPGASEAKGPARRVLLVDDHADSARALARLLRAVGHEVEVAPDGPSALAAARERPPEVILLDLGLPGMDGVEVARRLRADPPATAARIVALTGRGGDPDRRETAAAGFDDHLVKPVDLDRLRSLIEGARPAGPLPGQAGPASVAKSSQNPG